MEDARALSNEGGVDDEVKGHFGGSLEETLISDELDFFWKGSSVMAVGVVPSVSPPLLAPLSGLEDTPEELLEARFFLICLRRSLNELTTMAFAVESPPSLIPAAELGLPVGLSGLETYGADVLEWRGLLVLDKCDGDGKFS